VCVFFFLHLFPCHMQLSIMFLFLFCLPDGEYLFVDPENKLGKYAPKGWKSSHASVSFRLLTTTTTTSSTSILPCCYSLLDY
jgi:hypothetical protein